MDIETGEGAEASSVETSDINVEDLGADTGATETGTGEVSESGGDDTLYTVRVNGQEMQVSLQEALSGYQRQADYTQKTQELAEQRESLTFEGRVAAALENNPSDAVRALIQAYGLEDEFAAQQAAQATLDDEEDLDPIQKQIADQQRWIEDQEARQFEQQVQHELTTLHSEYGDFNDAELIQFMLDRQIPDFHDAAVVFVNDRATALAKRQQAEAANQARKEALPKVAGGTHTAGGTVQPGGTQRFTSVREAFADAMRQHGS